MSTVLAMLGISPVELIAFFVGAAGALAAFLGVRQSGKNAARAEQLQKTVEVKDAQQTAAANSPRGRDGVVDSLRRGEF